MTPEQEEIERKKAFEQFAASMRLIKTERAAAVEPAKQALHRLIDVMRGKTNQSEHVRSMLYSLWNGAPTSLIELLALDWQVRKDVLAVLMAFGDDDFFYDHIKYPITRAGLFDWFCKEP